MKKFVVGLFSVFVSLSAFPQDLVLKYGEQIVNNDTIYLNGTKSTELIEFRLSVTNNRSTSVALKLRKTEIFVVEGAECSFCWGECYTPAVNVSPMIITIQPGVTDRNSFIGDYRPFEMEGTSIVRYTFFNPADTSYQQSVTAFFQIGGSGLTQTDELNAAPVVYPNPANLAIRIEFPEPAQQKVLSLENINGRTVKSGILHAGQTQFNMPVSDLPPGYYFLKICSADGSRFVKKILVSH